MKALFMFTASVVVLLSLGLPASAEEAATYRDKNGYFEVSPPDGWVKKEFNDPRSKVSFDVPAPVAGQNKAGIFFLSHPVSREIDLKAEAEDRVARLKQMGSPDARATTVEFAGVKAERVDGQMGRQNMLLRVFMFTNYGRSYTVQYSGTKQDFDTYWPTAEAALNTFKCIPPAGMEATTPAAQVKIDAEKIRVWITALKEQDLGTDAMQSLLDAGALARPQLEEAAKTGTPLQKERATRILSTLDSETTVNGCPAKTDKGITVKAASQTAGEQSTLGEKAVVKMLGLEKKYDQLFSLKDHFGVIMSMPGDGSGQFSYTRQWNKSQTVVIGYSWDPKKLNPEQAKLKTEQLLKACGHPDTQTPTVLVYGRVTLSFSKEGYLSEVAICFNK